MSSSRVALCSALPTRSLRPPAPSAVTCACILTSAVDVGRNICHGSDSPESAKEEIALWFGEQDAAIPYTRAVDQWIYE